MSQISTPKITTEDFLRGEKEIQVTRRDGSIVLVKVKSLNWRTWLFVAENTVPTRSNEKILEDCLPKDQSTDEFLNTLCPPDLFLICRIAMELSTKPAATEK